MTGEPPTVNGYMDLNVTIPLKGPLGVTGGVIYHPDTGWTDYAGYVLASGPGMAITFGPRQAPTRGLNVGLQVGAVAGFQFGYGWGEVCEKGDEAPFWEIGFMTPGVSIQLFYIDPWNAAGQ